MAWAIRRSASSLAAPDVARWNGDPTHHTRTKTHRHRHKTRQTQVLPAVLQRAALADWSQFPPKKRRGSEDRLRRGSSCPTKKRGGASSGLGLAASDSLAIRGRRPNYTFDERKCSLLGQCAAVYR